MNKAFNLLKELVSHNYEAYLIGGYVRDKLLEIESTDIDIVTSAKPDEIISIFKNHKCDLVGKTFGVVIVDNIEIATFRKDNYDIGNMHVTFSKSLKEDVSRRDFTINSIAMDIYGQIYDYYNGVEDLKNRTIRFVGNPISRIEEDPVRMLRGIRFATKINGNIHENSEKAIRKSNQLIRSIPPERIRLEILKAIQTKNASRFFRLSARHNLLRHFLPELNESLGLSQNSYHDLTIFSHCMRTGDSISPKYPLLKLAGYLHDIGKSYVREYNQEKDDYTFIGHEKIGHELVINRLKELKFSNEEVKYVSTLVRHHMINPESLKGMKKLMLKLEDTGVTVKDFIRLKIADRRGKGEDYFMSVDKIRTFSEVYKKIINFPEPFALRHLAVNGHDVMDVLGIRPSPKVGEVLDQLLKIVLEDPKLNNREVLIQKIKELNYDRIKKN